MGKYIWLIFVLAFLGSCRSPNRLVNYNQRGEGLPAKAEVVQVELVQTADELGAESLIGGLLAGPVYNIWNAIVQENLARREERFIGTYGSSTVVHRDDLRDNSSKSLIIRRYGIDQMDQMNDNHLMVEMELPVEMDENGLVFSLESIWMKRTKVQYKSNDELSVGIQITVEELDGNPGPLGQGSILVPLFQFNEEPQNLRKYEQIINKIVLPLPTFSGNIKISVSVTETNSSRIHPNTLEKILMNNSEDVRTLLQTVFKR